MQLVFNAPMGANIASKGGGIDRERTEEVAGFSGVFVPETAMGLNHN